MKLTPKEHLQPSSSPLPCLHMLTHGMSLNKLILIHPSQTLLIFAVEN